MTMTDFEINDASDACFDLAEDSNVTLRDGEMNDCNSDGNSWGGAVINFPGSTSGGLTMENIDIDESMVNLINVDFEDVWISNLTATVASAQSGVTLGATGGGTDSTFYVYNMDAPDYGAVNIHALDMMMIEDADWGTSAVSIAPGGTTSSAAGPSGTSASIKEATKSPFPSSR